MNNKFKANGNTYVVLDKMPIDSYIQYEKLSVQMAYGTTIPEFMKNLRKAYDLVNAQKFADSAVQMHNIMSGILKLDDKERYPYGLMICTLFIKEESKVKEKWSEDLANKAINDWIEEGLDVGYFFQLAKSSILNLGKELSELVQQEAKKILETTE